MRKNRNSIQYLIHIKGRKPIYIPSKYRPVARLYAVKADLSALRRDLAAKLKICECFSVSVKKLPHARMHLQTNPEFTKLLSESYRLLAENGSFYQETEKYVGLFASTSLPVLQSAGIQDPDLLADEITYLLNPGNHDETVSQWLTEPYNANPYHPEYLKYMTSAGEKMRSKLEVLTAELLKLLEIPYHYEEELRIGNGIYFPDFTLMHPRRHTLVYLEIFGMMSNDGYAESCGRKMCIYLSNGLAIGQNLFCYSETEQEPLDFQKMKIDLEYWLLS